MLTVWGLEGAEAGPEVLGPKENLRSVNPATMTYPRPPPQPSASLWDWTFSAAALGDEGGKSGTEWSQYQLPPW